MATYHHISVYDALLTPRPNLPAALCSTAGLNGAKQAELIHYLCHLCSPVTQWRIIAFYWTLFPKMWVNRFSETKAAFDLRILESLCRALVSAESLLTNESCGSHCWLRTGYWICHYTLCGLEEPVTGVNWLSLSHCWVKLINEGFISTIAACTPLTSALYILHCYVWVKLAWESAFGMIVMCGMSSNVFPPFPVMMLLFWQEDLDLNRPSNTDKL